MLNQVTGAGHFVPLPHITQQTDSHCGPAALQLLYSRLHRSFTQDQITVAAGAANRIEEYGTGPEDLALAVTRLTPDLQFWFKQPASWHDLVFLIHKYHWPVAVNWQGLFYDTVEEEARESPYDDHGHYSIVTNIDMFKREITLYDPYAEYSVKPRVFSFDWFAERWWDTNEETDTRRFIFIVTSRQALFPRVLKMQPPQALPNWKHGLHGGV